MLLAARLWQDALLSGDEAIIANGAAAARGPNGKLLPLALQRAPRQSTSRFYSVEGKWVPVDPNAAMEVPN